ncbi:putative monocarboxylate transporter mch1 [Quaeritorhiza haematococci]|nr:putative monocarboxylate transporter mch1 [Quaeritorhiza haematococci]
MNMVDTATLQQWAQEVLALCPEKKLDEVIADLQKTQSVEHTINRIFDGQFLEGTTLDPSLQFAQLLSSPQSRLPFDDDLDRFSPPPLPLPLRLSPILPATREPHPASPQRRWGLDREREVTPAEIYVDSGDEQLPGGSPIHKGLGRSISPSLSEKEEEAQLAAALAESLRDERPQRLSDASLIDLSMDDAYSDALPLPKSDLGEPKSAVSAQDIPERGRRSNSVLSRSTSDLSARSAAHSHTDFNDEFDEAEAPKNGGTGSKREDSPESDLDLSLNWDQHFTSTASAPSRSGSHTRDETTPTNGRNRKRKTFMDMIPVEDTVSVNSSPSSSVNASQSSTSTVNNEDDEEEIVKTKPKRRRKSEPETSKQKEEKEREKEREKEALKAEREKAKKEKELEKERKRLEREMKKAEKEALKRQKEHEKEMKRLEKEKQKEEKEKLAQAKKESKEANKIRNKKDTIKEMLVDIDNAFIREKGAQVILKLQEEGALVDVQQLPVPSTIRWKRKVSREWDDELGIWKRCEERIEEEGFCLARVFAEEFAQAISIDGMRGMLETLRQAYPGKKIVLLIEGLDKYFKSKVKAQRDQFAAAVRMANGYEESAAAKARAKKNQAQQAGKSNLPDRQTIEDFMLTLQLDDGCIVQISKDAEETADWVASYTREIAILPETRHRSMEAFELKFGDSIKSGKDLTDTWSRMLQQVHLVNETYADAVISRYPTLTSLYNAYNNSRSVGEAQNVLADIQLREILKPLVLRGQKGYIQYLWGEILIKRL